MEAKFPLSIGRVPWVGLLALLLTFGQTLPAAARTPSAGDLILPLLRQDCTTQLSIDRPASGGSVAGTFTVSGWAVDLSAPSGSGIDAVRLYWDAPSEEGGVGLGVATIGLPRPDVDASLGLANSNAGWELTIDFSTLPAGWHVLYAYARSLCGWSYIAQDVYVEPRAAAPAPAPEPAPAVSQPAPAVQPAQPVVRIEAPTSGSQTSGPITVVGYAVDCATGQPASSVKLYSGTTTPTLLGTVTPSTPRDLASLCGAGRSGTVNAGFAFQVSPSMVASGSQTLTVIAEAATWQANGSVVVHVGGTATAGSGGTSGSGSTSGSGTTGPYGGSTSPYGGSTSPYGGSTSPYGGSSGYGSTGPYGSQAGSTGYGSTNPLTNPMGATSPTSCPVGSTYSPTASGCAPGAGSPMGPSPYGMNAPYTQPMNNYPGTNPYLGANQCPVGSVMSGNQCIPTTSYYGSGLPSYGSPYGIAGYPYYGTGFYGAGYGSPYAYGAYGYGTPYYGAGYGYGAPYYGTSYYGYGYGYGVGSPYYGAGYGYPYSGYPYAGYGGYPGYGYSGPGYPYY